MLKKEAERERERVGWVVDDGIVVVVVTTVCAVKAYAQRERASGFVCSLVLCGVCVCVACCNKLTHPPQFYPSLSLWSVKTSLCNF